jgi:hypothetical protein
VTSARIARALSQAMLFLGDEADSAVETKENEDGFLFRKVHFEIDYD